MHLKQKKVTTTIRKTVLKLKNNLIQQSDTSGKHLHVRKFRGIYNIIATLSPSEKMLLWALSAILTLSSITLALDVNNQTTSTVPDFGGQLTEGLIGTARFINPLLAKSDTDRDLVSIVYSGLMKATPDGELITDLAKRYSISKDGKKYTFMLKDNVVFHDGTPVTADDIVFTISMAQNSTLNSPRYAEWEGVTVTRITDREVSFTLKKAYAPFLQNTTIGILPAHLWQNITPDEFQFSNLNINPVGSGPYKVKTLKLSSSGIPSKYIMASFAKYALGKPFIPNLNFILYQNEETALLALENKTIDSLPGISPASVSDNNIIQENTLIQAPFPRIFAVFFNQNKNKIFSDKTVRHALDTSINKKSLIDTVLLSYGSVLNSPIPDQLLQKNKSAEKIDTRTREESLADAKKILEDGGWKFDKEKNTWTKKEETLSFSLATANTPELKSAANTIAKIWSDLGIRVSVKIFEPSDLTQTIIRPREYDALLFGEVVGRSMDLFALWHSSQRTDPGLNIAMYANVKADKLLAKARETSDLEERLETYLKVEKLITQDYPAVFLYSPNFIYITPKYINGIDLQLISKPSDRFGLIHKWFIETDNVWHFFIK